MHSTVSSSTSPLSTKGGAFVNIKICHFVSSKITYELLTVIDKKTKDETKGSLEKE